MPELSVVQLHLHSLSSTKILGEIIGRLALPGDILCLDGDLGAGKTTLTQAIAVGLGVSEESYVSSPSFAILHEHMGRIPLYHMDFYRLGDPVEIEEHGFSEYFDKEGLCVIEWAVIGEEMLPEPRLHISLDVDQNLRRYATIQGEFRKKDFAALFRKSLIESKLLKE